MAALRQRPTVLDIVPTISTKDGSSTRMVKAAISVVMAVNGMSDAQEY
jgi:hypothetical protein